MPVRVYLDNCAFNRPFDDSLIARNKLESEAKIQIQDRVRMGELELVWSYILEFESEMSPHPDRQEQIQSWRAFSVEIILRSQTIEQTSQSLVNAGVQPKDSLHLACAIAGKCGYFVTTDDRLLNKRLLIPDLEVLNPRDFVLL